MIGLQVIANADAVNENVPQLTVWIRAGGKDVKSEITPFLQRLLEIVPEGRTQILICTNENDIILEELKSFYEAEKSVKLIFSTLSSYSLALTALAQNTNPESSVLSLSVGVDIRKDQLEEGLSNLKGRVRVYGWKIHEFQNDGTVPGKGWYNTAALIDKTIVRQIKEGSVPQWVDNGVLGKIDNYTIGGNEEIPMMVEALQRDPEARFILNVGDPVSLKLQLGTGVNYQEKLERKVAVSCYYLRKLYQETCTHETYESWFKSIWNSLEVIDFQKRALIAYP